VKIFARIYRITNKINGKRYIGITRQNTSQRWASHIHQAKTGNNRHLYNAIRKYNKGNFYIDCICICFDESGYEIEKQLIIDYDSIKNGYNNSVGGEKSTLGCKWSKESRKKLSDTQKGKKRKPLSDELKKRLSEIAKGRDMTKAIKASIKANKGKPAHNRKPVILNDKVKFNSIREASQHFNCSMGSISNNLKGLSKTTKFGTWEYL